MNITEEIDDYLRESIEYSLGLPVSNRTMELKLQSCEEARRHILDQCFYLKAKLLEKDKTIERIRAEASMNAQAIKKFVEENKKLAEECAELLARCEKFENECSLYDCDLEALMDFGNEADARAVVAESRVHYLEEELSKLTEEVQSFKQQQVGKLTDNEYTEDVLVDTLLSTLTNKAEVASIAHSFLEENSGIDVCQKLLQMWDRLKPSTQEVLSLASEVQKLQKDKEHIIINLVRAEEEVAVLSDENSMLDEENLKLTKLLQEERHNLNSGRKSSSGSIKMYKRKSYPCPKENSPTEKKLDFDVSASSPREALSPLPHNT